MRLGLRRRDCPPAGALAVLERDERVVSWADVEGGAVVLATPRGLWWPAADGHRLIGWQFVDKAVWRDNVFSVIEADLVDDLLLVDRPAVHVSLTTPRDLPPTVRRRVEANVIHTDLVQIAGATVRLIGRRVPGNDGLVWWARLSTGTPDTPEVRNAVSARLAQFRDEMARRSD